MTSSFKIINTFKGMPRITKGGQNMIEKFING